MVAPPATTGTPEPDGPGEGNSGGLSGGAIAGIVIGEFYI